LNYKDKLEDTSKIGFFNRSEKKIDLLLEDTNKLTDIREPKFNLDNSGFYFILDSKKIIQRFISLILEIKRQKSLV
jgi:hypothetical protein